MCYKHKSSKTRMYRPVYAITYTGIFVFIYFNWFWGKKTKRKNLQNWDHRTKHVSNSMELLFYILSVQRFLPVSDMHKLQEFWFFFMFQTLSKEPFWLPIPCHGFINVRNSKVTCMPGRNLKNVVHAHQKLAETHLNSKYKRKKKKEKTQ